MGKFMNALGFLTIIKIHKNFLKKPENISNSTLFFPLVGLIIGAAITIFYFAAGLVFPLIVSIILMVGFEILITGGSHIDGFADMFDGTFSGKSREKILDIMKKSDIGVFGVTAVVFLILLKISFLYFTAIKAPAYLFYFIIIFMPAFGRISMTFMMAKYSNTRGQNSLAGIFTDNIKKRKNRNFFIGAAYMILLFLVAFFLVIYLFQKFPAGPAVPAIKINFSYAINPLFTSLAAFSVNLKAAAILVIVPILAAVPMICLMIFFGWFFTRRIGGITGDILGGVSELMELSFLAISFLIINFLA